MCGICASISDKNQINNVLKNLKTLEYRGYDSCGISFFEKGKIKTIKTVGQIENLVKKVKDEKSNIVIGHTRWATHGGVSENNSHPQLSNDGKVSVVHNGIIENYKELKKDYLSKVNFSSETDTEVISNMIAIQSGSNLEKIANACKKLQGSYAICVLFEGDESVYFAKNGSPLYVSSSQNCMMASSDIYALKSDKNSYYMINDAEIGVLKNNSATFFDFELNKINKKLKKIVKNDNLFLKNNSKNIMINEIIEQTNVLKKSYFYYFKENILNKNFIEKLNNFKNYYFIACGTAYHSALLGAKYIEKFCKKRCKIEIASEFRYSGEIISKDTLYVFVSQSGETADTIACAKYVKRFGGKSLAVTNVEYCTLNHITNYVLPTFAEKEFAVAATKTYTAQIFALLSLALLLGKQKKIQKRMQNFVSHFDFDLETLDFSKKLLSFKKVFFIGRQQDYVTSLEACLKLREISYINCMALQAGELKHGSLALVDKDSLFFVISTQKSLKGKIENAIQEIKARSGKVFLISQFKHGVECDYFMQLKKFDECFMPIVSIIPFQKLAFEVCLEQGFNPDKPRNLAKSVTVE